MKKNRMMRAASALLVAVLMTTCTISGTFAKYVTEASAADTARVAKWGVEVTATGETFAQAYDADKTDKTVSVAAGSTEKLVAPGTKNDAAATFTIKGTPEVATKVSVTFNKDDKGNDLFKDVYLKAGEYTDYTKVTGYKDGKATYDTFELENDYYPIKWTLMNKDESEEDKEFQELKTGSLSDIKSFIETYVSTAEYAPNENLGSEFKLSWTWEFAQNNQADTLLGNIAAGTAEMPTKDNVAQANIGIAYDITITVEQVD